jgi:hypothetical protein
MDTITIIEYTSTDTIIPPQEIVEHHRLNQVQFISEIDGLSYLWVRTIDSIVTADSVDTTGVWLRHTDTAVEMVSLILMLSEGKLTLDSVKTRPYQLPLQVGNTWKSVDYNRSSPFLWIFYPAFGVVTINGNARIDSTTTYNFAGADRECYLIDNNTETFVTVTADSLWIFFDTLAYEGDTVFQSHATSDEQHYVNNEFSIPLWSHKEEVAWDTDNSEDKVTYRVTVMHTYVTRLYDPSFDKLYLWKE